MKPPKTIYYSVVIFAADLAFSLLFTFYLKQKIENTVISIYNYLFSSGIVYFLIRNLLLSKVYFITRKDPGKVVLETAGLSIAFNIIYRILITENYSLENFPLLFISTVIPYMIAALGGMAMGNSTARIMFNNVHEYSPVTKKILIVTKAFTIIIGLYIIFEGYAIFNAPHNQSLAAIAQPAGALIFISLGLVIMIPAYFCRTFIPLIVTGLLVLVFFAEAETGIKLGFLYDVPFYLPAILAISSAGFLAIRE